MPAATFGFHFFDPSPSTHKKNESALVTNNQQPPFLVTFASSPACLPTAQKLSEAGWLVLAVDIQQSTYVELALDLISPLSLYQHWKWLKPAAIILVNEDEHRSVQSDALTQPVLPLPLRRLISLLLGRGLSSREIPYLLYLNAPHSSPVPANLEESTSTAAANNPLPLDKVGGDNHSMFRAILPQTVKDEALLAVIADLTQVFFCAGCRRRIEPQEKALLLAPQLFCEGCASFPSAVLDRYPQEKLPLFPARFLAKAARVFATSPTAKHPSEAANSLEEATSATSDPWSS